MNKNVLARRTNQTKMMNLKAKNIYTSAILAAVFLILFVIANNVFSQEKVFICPLKKMANVGGLTDQTAISVNEILLQTQAILNSAAKANQAAGDLITISQDECEPNRPNGCQSSCQAIPDYTACNTTTCKTDVPCCRNNFTCTLLNPTDPFVTRLSGSATSCSGISSFNRDPNKHYTKSKYRSNYYSWWSGECYNEACEEGETCDDSEKCSGNACPFGEIRNKVRIIETALIEITNAYNRINDFFNKEINQFPEEIDEQNQQVYQIFGKFNEHPILSELCVLTDFFGINPCDSEFNALVAIKDKAKENMKSCDIISSDDLFEGKQGESLFVCKDVKPDPVRQCWRNDFFCCSSQ